MFASPRFGSGSLHLTSLIHRGLSGRCFTVPAHRSAPLRSVAGTCSSSLLAPCSASRSSSRALCSVVYRDLYRSTASDLAPGARQPSAVIAGFCVPGRGCRSVMFASPRFGSGSLHLTSLIHRGLSGVPYGPGSSLRSASLFRRHLHELAPRAMLRIALVAGASPPHHISPVKPPAPEGGDIVSNSENPSGFLRSPIPKGIPSGTGDGGAPPGARKGRANL